MRTGQGLLNGEKSHVSPTNPWQEEQAQKPGKLSGLIYLEHFLRRGEIR